MRIKVLVLCFVHIISINRGFSQDQVIADSLFELVSSMDSQDSTYLITLYELSYYEMDPVRMLDYAERLIRESRSQSDLRFETFGYLSHGQAHMSQSNFEEALESFFNGLKLAIENGFFKHAGQFQSSIADIYNKSGNFKNAYTYYEAGIETLKKVNDSASLATLHLNYGDALFNNNELERAAENFEKSLDIFENLDYKEGVAFNWGNLGMVYAQQGKHSLAEENMNKAISIFEEMESFYPISVFLTYIADIYIEKGNILKALSFAGRSLDLAEEYGLKNEISGAHQKLSEIHEHFGYDEKAYHHYKAHIAMRDSINNIETVEALANQRTEFEVSQKQTELDLVDQRRKTQRIYSIAGLSGAGLLGLLATLLYRSNRFEKKTNKIIAKEKERSEKLLLNILPAETAEELKTNGKVKAKRYESASVLFADFVGFTKFSKNRPPEEVVETIDRYFIEFDNIVEAHGLEKIKTLGDGYMCAGGLPIESEDHAVKLIQAAQKMKKYVIDRKADENTPDSFGIRIGIHSGPVVSGVVGSKKFAYDIWGDTVNTAARLESHSEPGKINISTDTYQLVKDQFTCTERSAREVKGKGMMEMYFVKETMTE